MDCTYEYEESRTKSGSVDVCWRTAWTRCRECKRPMCINHCQQGGVCVACGRKAERAKTLAETEARWDALYARVGQS